MVGADSHTKTYGEYRGVDFLSLLNVNLRLQINLKKGKEIPAGLSLGFLHTNYRNNTYATWAINNGVLLSTVIEDSAKSVDAMFICGCYPNTEQVWDSIFDACDIMVCPVNAGDPSVPYEPYQGETSTLALPETIYGGTVDAVTGVGSKTWEFVEFDGTEDWYQNGENGYFLGEVIDIGPSGNRECISNIAVSSGIAINPIPDGQFNTWSFTMQRGWCGFSLSFADSLDSWKSYLAAQASAGTPVQVAYNLATPEPFEATGNQALPAVAGLNTVYTDGDSLDVTGRQDLLYTLQTMQAQTQNLNRFIAEGGTQ